MSFLGYVFKEVNIIEQQSGGKGYAKNSNIANYFDVN
jgi:hypothetical protein